MEIITTITGQEQSGAHRGKSFPSSGVPSAGTGNGQTLTSRKNQLLGLRSSAVAIVNAFQMLFAIIY